MYHLKKIAIVVGGIVGSYLLHFPLRLLEHWLMGEIEGKIAENWQSCLGFFISWILPLIVVFGAIWLGYWAKKPKLVPQNVEAIEQKESVSNRQPIRLIPKRKIKRIIHRTETIDGKTKYIDEVELDP